MPLLLFALPALVTVMGGGCNTPMVKKIPPPQAQLDDVPPTPLAPGPAAKTAPAAKPGGSGIGDSRLADLASQVEALRARLQIVEGKLAEQENQLGQLARPNNPDQRQVRDQFTALQRDLAGTQDRLTRLESARSSSQSQPAGAPSIQEVPPPPAIKTGADIFQEAAGLYKQKSYGAARQKFQQFLQDSPKSDKALEARYYAADCLLQEKKYDESIVEFNKIVEGHPKSSFAPPALLKQSQAFKAQGKTKIANLVIEKLIADYPKSPEALQARRLQGNRP